jgi:hypothetical protein
MKMPENWKSRSLVINTLDQNVVGQLALQVAIHRDGWIISSWGFGMMMSTRRRSIHFIWVVIIWVVSSWVVYNWCLVTHPVSNTNCDAYR